MSRAERFNILIKPRVHRDALSIVAYLMPRSPQAAVAFTERLQESIESLETLPRRNRRALSTKNSAEHRRCIVIGFPNYYIIYQIRVRDVIILRVRHAARRWPPGLWLA